MLILDQDMLILDEVLFNRSYQIKFISNQGISILDQVLFILDQGMINGSYQMNLCVFNLIPKH